MTLAKELNKKHGILPPKPEPIEEDIFSPTFGRKVLIGLAILGINKTEFAKKMGYSYPHVNSLIKGTDKITCLTQDKFNRYFLKQGIDLNKIDTFINDIKTEREE